MKAVKKTIAQKVAEDKQVNLRAQLEQEEHQKTIACHEEINAVLKKYDRGLAGSLTFVMNKAPIWSFTVVQNK